MGTLTASPSSTIVPNGPPPRRPHRHTRILVAAVMVAGLLLLGVVGAVVLRSGPAAPPAPTDLVATARSAVVVRLTWVDNATDETGFDVLRSTDRGVTWTTVASLTNDSTGWTDTGRAPRTTYTYRVDAVRGVESSPSDTASVTTPGLPPSAPSAPTARALSSTTVEVQWEGSPGTVTFEVERSVDAGTTWTVAADDLPARLTAWTDQGRSPATTYVYRVRALNDAGASPWSAVASATTLDVVPAVPTDLSAIAVSPTQIDLAWADPASNETGFRLERSTVAEEDWAVVFEADEADLTSWSDVGLEPDTAYSYRLAAVNSVGWSAWATASATTLAAPPAPAPPAPAPPAPAPPTPTPLPAAPASLTATATSPTVVKLTWVDKATDETRFEVQRSTNAGSTWATAVSDLRANTTTWTDTGRTPATSYSYRVRSANAAGASAWSASASARTPAALPAAPTGLAAIASSPTQMRLVWFDNADNETGFEVQRSLDGQTWATAANLKAGVTSWTDTGRTPGTTYAYRVRAANAAGPSAWSDTATATTPEVPPAAPAGLAVSRPTTTSLDLSWVDKASNEAGFEVQRSSDAGANWVTIAVLATNASSWTDSGLLPGGTYVYRVRATNRAGASPWSASASGTTVPLPPTTPADLSAAAVSPSRVDLRWVDHATNEVGYEVQRSTNAAWVTVALPLPAGTTTWSDLGRSPSTTFAYRVRAFNIGGASAWSNVATVSTPPLGIPADVTFLPVAPARVFDTRDGTGGVAVGKLGANRALAVRVAGRHGVPATGVAAVSLNVTVVDPAGDGYVTVYPCGVVPLVADVRYQAGQTAANAVLAPVSPNGDVCFYTVATTHLVVDVNGWFPTRSGFTPLELERVFDTRDGAGGVPVGRLGADRVLTVRVAGGHGVPGRGVTAVSLTVTATEPATNGYLTVYGCGDRPATSNVDLTAGRTSVNLVVAALNASGDICVASSTPTHVVAHVDGWFATAAGYAPVPPVRILDTRDGTGGWDGQVAAGQTVTLRVAGRAGVPATGAAGVSLNVAMVRAETSGFLTVYGCGARPWISNVNVAAGQTSANAVLAPVSPSGDVCLYSSTAAHVVVDLAGWFAPPTP